jgi:hypothetical protein
VWHLFLIVAVGLFGIGAVLWFAQRRTETKRLDAANAAFGQQVRRERVRARISALFTARQAREPNLGRVHERTWEDLDMDLVFDELDRTVSHIGSQTLYDRLRRPDEAQIHVPELDRLAEGFGDDDALRSRYQRTLDQLRAWQVAYMADLIWDESPPQFRFAAFFPFLSLLPVALVLLSSFWPRMLRLALCACVAHLLLRVSLRARIDPFVPAIQGLPAFVRAARWIARQSDDVCRAPRTRLLKHMRSLRFLEGSSRWLIVDSNEGAQLGPLGDVLLSVHEYLSMVFLLDLNAFRFVTERIGTDRASIQAVFAEIGNLDVAISLASVRRGAARWARPVKSAAPRCLVARRVVHPLLADAIPNDLVMEGMNCLVTGSNMSGKSTLLRTVGVNALLARSIGTVFAEHWESPPFVVRTCINRSDSLISGKSYYLAEAEAVKEIIDAATSTAPHLFIFDELFRGTNTVERIAMGRAILTHLDREPHLVLVATHDVELTRYLAERYKLLHFREQVVRGGLTFDYLIKPGLSSTRNAIALLAALHYPDEIVRLAEKTAGSRDDQGLRFS